jgi:hypothetical protein
VIGAAVKVMRIAIGEENGELETDPHQECCRRARESGFKLTHYAARETACLARALPIDCAPMAHPEAACGRRHVARFWYRWFITAA